jgi:hypothetical protein
MQNHFSLEMDGAKEIFCLRFFSLQKFWNPSNPTFRCELIELSCFAYHQHAQQSHTYIPKYIFTVVNVGLKQGCQIFLCTTNQNGKNVPKLPQKYRNTIYQMAMKYTKNFNRRPLGT